MSETDVESGPGEWLQFASIAGQLGLLVLLIRQFALENQAFSQTLMPIVFVGFVVHYLLPLRYRLPFFLLLSLSCMIAVVGPGNGGWLIVVGLVLVGTCHLPIAFAARVALLLGAGAVAAAMRANWLPSPWSSAIWPVLASLFMFRLIIYMYELRHEKEPASIATTLSYFFLLPNIVFLLFPVVDYNTFRRTYYDDDRHRIYQRGVEWMLRGVTHLILYRFVDHYLVIAPADVTSTSQLVRYLVANFLLYLRVSGQFHLAVGILHLFGFNLPETNRLYYLSSSFTDFWRRINVYWKDFMLKIFYYPTYFRLRQFGTTTRLVVSTLVVFIVTWLLHTYQWFWLRGSFLLSIPDVLFWSILAALVVVATLLEAKRGRKRTLGTRTPTAGEIAGVTFRAVCTFTTLTLLWSLWSSASIPDWLSLFAVVEPNLQTFGLLALVFMAIGVIFGAGVWMEARPRAPKREADFAPPTPLRRGAVAAVTLVAIYTAGTPMAYSQLAPGGQEVIQSLRGAYLNDRDAALLEAGYYENLNGVNQFNSQLWDLYMKRPAEWLPIGDTELGRQTGDFLVTELAPGATGIFHGKPFSTNRWAMRDRDYEREKPPGTYRIALLGSSIAMGSGVADGETFEGLLEDRLNRENDATTYERYEILNLSVAGYSPLQELRVLETKGSSFAPDAVFFVAHQDTQTLRVANYLFDFVQDGVDIPYDGLRELVDRAGVEPGMTWPEARRRFEPLYDEICSWLYRRVVQESGEIGAVPVWIFLQVLGKREDPEQIAELFSHAEEAGFVVVDLSDVYDGHMIEELRVAEWDLHPNATGHRLVAERLHGALRGVGDRVPLGVPGGTRNP